MFEKVKEKCMKVKVDEKAKAKVLEANVKSVHCFLHVCYSYGLKGLLWWEWFNQYFSKGSRYFML